MENLLNRKRELNDLMTALEGRELNEQEQAAYEAYTREWKQINRQIELETAAREAEPAPASKQQQVRELLLQARENVQREIIVGTTTTPGAGLNSGAINLTIADLIPTLEEGTTLPASLPFLQGVRGDVVYPTDALDMEIEEAGETAIIADKEIDFDSVKAAPSRVTLSCDISNKLIDNLAFDVLSLIQSKFEKAWRMLLAKKIYSPAAFTGLKGGFSGLTSAGTITIGDTAAAQILAAIATFTDKGMDTTGMCIVIDAASEARLKVTPVAEGQGGFIIANGKLLGYDYVVSHYINTKLNDQKVLVTDTVKHLGIGFFNYLPVQQHGEYRLTIDGTSKAQAKKNCTGITLNTELSITNLGGHIHTPAGTAVPAFALYTLA